MIFIEEDLRRVVETSRTIGKTLAAFNTTFIALIPKTDNPTCFENFNQYHYVIAFIKSYQILLLEG
jgi:hypothetical protein